MAALVTVSTLLKVFLMCCESFSDMLWDSTESNLIAVGATFLTSLLLCFANQVQTNSLVYFRNTLVHQ